MKYTYNSDLISTIIHLKIRYGDFPGGPLALLTQRAWVRFLARELDPARHN